MGVRSIGPFVCNASPVGTSPTSMHLCGWIGKGPVAGEDQRWCASPGACPGVALPRRYSWLAWIVLLFVRSHKQKTSDAAQHITRTRSALDRKRSRRQKANNWGKCRSTLCQTLSARLIRQGGSCPGRMSLRSKSLFCFTCSKRIFFQHVSASEEEPEYFNHLFLGLCALWKTWNGTLLSCTARG